MSEKRRSARLAVDIGGTFTDIVLLDGDRRYVAKLLTTPREPEVAVIEGARSVLAKAGLTFGDIGVFVHGTTLATNALIERKGARTALVTTAGFRDVLEMGYEKRYEHYDLNLELPPPLVPRELRFPVTERMTAKGKIDTPLNEKSFPELISQFKKNQIQSVAIGFLHSYVNDAHEKKAGALLAAALPGLSITLSSEVCPEIREYERFSTTTADVIA